MSYTIESIPDLSGTTSMVTGANSGLGLATSVALATKGSHVILASRNLDKARAAAEMIITECPSASLEVVQIDLGSLESVARAVDEVTIRHSRIDVLVNNAGLMAMPEGRTVDGFETQFGVNHLGHWALTARLMPALLAAPRARVVTVTSSAHHFGRSVGPSVSPQRGRYSAWGSYGSSKLANYHFAIGLQHHFERIGSKASSLLAHPGLSNTNLQVQTVEEGAGGVVGDVSLALVRRIGMTAERGALSQIRAATDPRAKGGQFFAPRWFTAGPPVVRPIVRPGNRKAITRLWALSEQATGLALHE
jgi:NAD(P)-dependent dehydrogenase (short-subunit alcohol dehydrogenase family)